LALKKKRVYLETSVISYLTARPSRDVVLAFQQAATKLWWQEHRPLFDVFVSELVDDEIEQGDANAVRRRQESVIMLERKPVTSEAIALADRLLHAHALPRNAKGDAMHVALAAVHEMDILLTWNCRHIANDAMEPKIVATIVEANYKPPRITTPEKVLKAPIGE